MLGKRLGVFSENRRVEAEVRISFVDLEVNEHAFPDFFRNVFPKLCCEPHFLCPQLAVSLCVLLALFGESTKGAQGSKN